MDIEKFGKGGLNYCDRDPIATFVKFTDFLHA